MNDSLLPKPVCPMVKQYPLSGLFIPYRRRSPEHWPIVVHKSCDFRFLLFLLNKRNALEKSTVYPVTFYWSTRTKPGGVIYMWARDIEFTYFYDFSIECWNCSDRVIYIFFHFIIGYEKNRWVIWLWSSSVIKIVKMK